MRIIHCLASLEPAYGGPARSVPQLATALNKLGHEVGLWSPLPGPEVLCDCVQESRTQRFSGSFSDTLTEFGKPDLVHDHGLWQPCHHQVARVCARRGIPRIASPRGMLEPWALQYKRWKKQMAWWLYQRRDLRSAKCLHATAKQEVAAVRNLGLPNPIALIPNGVVVPPLMSESRSQRSEVRKALFLSRIHRKKGLLNLVKAWHELKPGGWQLIIAGPDEGGHLAEVQAAVRACGLEKQILFQGEIMGEAKIQCYADADLFVLPSFSENFGLVVAEALSCGVPVITTRATPWEELETHRCGWWIDIGVEPLAAALREATSLSDQERCEMGQRGCRLVEEKYSWPQIGRDMLAVYQWVLGQASRPQCVIT
jgi:glycosyltransferase involved in cell wall biosynthesis